MKTLSRKVMHRILHHFGDWELETRHMSRLERSIYFDMRTAYLTGGVGLPADLELLERRLMCNESNEKEALRFLLRDKFKLDKKSNQYKHIEWNQILRGYKEQLNGNDGVTERNGSSNDGVTGEVTERNAMSNAERQQKLRQQAREMKSYLDRLGIVFDRKMPFVELRELFKTHAGELVERNDGVTERNDGVTERNGSNEANNAEKVSITINQKPITNNHKPNIKTSITQSAGADAVVCAGVELNEHQAEEIPSETQQKTKKISKADAWKALLAENGIVGQLADDYIAIRLAKNAPLTATAMEGLKREAAKAGMTLEQAITYSTEQGWQGFKAEWLLNKVFGGNQSKPQNRINDLPKHTQGGAFLAKDIF